MNIQNTKDFFKNELKKATNKREIKVYKSFISILSPSILVRCMSCLHDIRRIKVIIPRKYLLFINTSCYFCYNLIQRCYFYHKYIESK